MNNLSNIKRFFKTIFRNIDFEKEVIRILQEDKEKICRAYYFNDIDTLVNSFGSKYVWNNNTYFQLATTDKNGGTTENLKYRYCLGFDFDKKDFKEEICSNDITELFIKNKIYCHCIVDSGNGYHAYILINKTDKLDLVEEVQKALCDKLGADKNAIKATQLLRVPYTYNIKSDKHKQVRVIYLADRHNEKFKAYDIEFLYEKNCNRGNLNNKKEYIFNKNIPKCIKNVLKNGSLEGDRYRDLQNIIVALRKCNESLENIKEIVKRWAEKSNFNDNLNYRIEHIYNNKRELELECKNCLEFNNCYNKVVSDFDFEKLIDDEEKPYNTYTLENKIMRKIKNKRNRGKNMLGGNETLLLTIFKNEFNNPTSMSINGLNFKMIMKEITYKKKSCLSEKTTRETLKKLVDGKYINESSGPKGEKLYKFNPIKTKIDNTITISYFATIMCICGNITTNELSLYILLRYIQKKQVDEKKTSGNIIQINQTEIAKAFYGNSNKEENQSHISKMINNLIECKILKIDSINKSNNNGFDYYSYRLNS